MFSVLTMICLSPLNSADQRCFSYSAPNMVETYEACEAQWVPTIQNLVGLIQSRTGPDIEIVSVDATCVSWISS